ncbi:MAG: pirin family protein [Gammaproteobacteria bacterium]
MRTIKQVFRGVNTQDGAGVSIRRVIGSHFVREIDPFLLLDELHSDNPDDYIAGFPPHPHRGFETITYMLQGLIRHKDSLGNEGLVGSGGVQWMHAGRGIIHSEIPEQADGLLWGFQIWLNLPASDKMTAATHRDISVEEIPQLHLKPGVEVRLIAGTGPNGERGPLVRDDIQATLLDVKLAANATFSWPVPDEQTLLLYVYDGELFTKHASYPYGNLLQYARGNASAGNWQVQAGENGAGVLLLAATPINEPIVRAGPFVMNTETELRQAIDDYQTGRLAEPA